ncbi:PREDICTED: ion transport peptide-like isoform X1 [Nicrophorus vespilloides]|uniref:Ion transport peptide-like isoform X1 n=1 Tax=Nicrophorus vespilloides TaxID=110193 RepID=A0ABM1MWI5_NICVS|nr:PREDICTED: ion transport peptide-like isoform X1 [Nicrophorus vespilloides]XP_017778935.1 PREDICTED: ion transport peptide-like isoform X1 [Nicrophorus vespilloides]XP_017778936.1 PREDICTED: ion transport peptide-like isoform X1 [Nicrophorus vespilloides]
MHHRSASISTQRVWAFMALALVLQMVSGSPAQRMSPLLSHHLSKRGGFLDLQCKGVYESSIFAKLDRICEDCYNLFREPKLQGLCKNNCFTTNIFKGCLESLQLNDEMEQVQTWIKQLHGAEPGF